MLFATKRPVFHHTHTHTHTHSKYCFVIVRLGLVVSETQQLLSIVQPTRSAASWLSLVTSLMNRAELTLCRERTHTHTHTHTHHKGFSVEMRSASSTLTSDDAMTAGLIKIIRLHAKEGSKLKQGSDSHDAKHLSTT